MCRIPRADRALIVSILGAAVAASTVGCGGADELPRQAVSGAVQFEGRPLKSGMIQFQPDSPDATTAAGAGIVDGSYSIVRSQGLVPGKYKAMITSTSPSPEPARTSEPGDPSPPAREPIPTKYNSNSGLSAQVTKEGPNRFDFELKSGN
jgi:hypothetical protein